jgi:transposase
MSLGPLAFHWLTPAVHGVVRWRLIDLAAWVWDEFGISMSESAMSRTLKALGFAKLSARPRHQAQNELAAERFKKDFPPS